MIICIINTEAGSVWVSAATKKASDFIGDWDRSADFTSQFTIWVGFDGNGDFDTFHHLHFFQNEHVWIIFVGIFLNLIPWDMNCGELAIK